ncbi:2-oxoglutarate synthase subunit alpha [candidate division WOR-3 bacterium JGI_Cruoil_03_51_56]|uniref:2-oxoglutarate synthase subunit alpha n=1 Tax=candidate division WOR-3 bacterium JGI_Cruoil_03_51_56 TaxID=1973747 RepID=A0A235BNX2_UNCW3|nr:MAG: 2-oxoglutarate synthase subunit alpha [candidate division WOR-3 bacterium JGI_Cruoil_03_51_56]
MKSNTPAVLTGAHYWDGDFACAEGAIAVGCRFFAGYPITPSTEVAERIALRFPLIGGVFVQMEDELGSMAAILGAAWAGTKSMTVTSGPGFSLMQENIGLGAMTETPCIVVNVQRGGPSTGLPTLTGQQDMMQARWGSHGDYEIIALSPSSPQECFDLTITCFNLSEKYRVPVLLMMDECVGHMTEKVVVPALGKIKVQHRRWYRGAKEKYRPYVPAKDGVPPMVKTGDDYRFHITGLTHDQRGYPVINPACQKQCVGRLVRKIKDNADKIIILKEEETEDADVIVVSYGISYRVATKAIADARKKGVKVGSLRLITVWPFPEKRIVELAKKTKCLVMPEINQGQVYLALERCAKGMCKTKLVPHYGGWVHDPNDILKAIIEGAR